MNYCHICVVMEPCGDTKAVCVRLGGTCEALSDLGEALSDLGEALSDLGEALSDLGEALSDLRVALPAALGAQIEREGRARGVQNSTFGVML